MFRKLILTTVCALLACAPQGSCSRRARALIPAEEAFVAQVFAARDELSDMIRRIPLQTPASRRVPQTQVANKVQTGGERRLRRAQQISDMEEQRPDQVPTLADAISKADECVRLCDQKITESEKMAGSCGIPQKRGQASFLKKVLENIQKVQAGQELTREEEEDFEAADCGYRGEIGPLVTAARQTLLARSQQ